MPPPSLHKDMAIPVATIIPAQMDIWMVQSHVLAYLLNSTMMHSSGLVSPITFSKSTVVEVAACGRCHPSYIEKHEVEERI